MSGTINQEVAAAEVPSAQPEQDDTKFFFSLTADDTGITELKFRKQSIPLFATLFFALDYINQSFDQPFPTLGTFLRDMADKADQMEAAYNARQQASESATLTPATEVGEPAAN